MDKEKALAAINARWGRRCACTLRAQATQAVPGDGSAEAEVMFIGEAPGKHEDIQGKPFVGTAGKFLSEMLASIGLGRGDIYITNIVKYRPPENRDPSPEEIAACGQWLREQIAIIDPKIIVTLGRHALEHFIPGKKISEAHGRTFSRVFPDIGTRTFLALYHPAAALYNGGMRETLLADFKKIPQVLAEMKKTGK